VRLIFPSAAGGSDIPAAAPPGEAAGDPASTAASQALAALYAYPDLPRPWVRANMISSADGAAALDGRSGGLSGRADRAVFAVLRSLADVIVVGANTARTERYRPVRAREVWPALRGGRSATPPIAVVSRGLGLDPADPLLAGGPGLAPTIVLTTSSAPPGRLAALGGKARVVTAGETSVRPAAAVAALGRLGYRRILAEGGPGLLGQVAEAGMLDELCLTISPVLAGGPAGRIVMAAASLPGGTVPALPAGMALAHVLEEEGYLLCRYVRHATP
jgi:riboflavin biosynthesis pyrimidine reductase